MDSKMLGNVSYSRRYLRKSLVNTRPDGTERRSDSIDEKRTDGGRSIASEAEVADLLFDPNQERSPEPSRSTVKSKPPPPMEVDPEESGLGESEMDESYGSSSAIRPAESQPVSFAVAPQSKSSDSIIADIMDAPRILDALYPPGRDDMRRIKLAAFLKSPEYLNRTPEDPQTLMPFVVKLPNGMHECSVCKYQQKRTDRIVSHFRRHINHRPYACDGSCGHEKCSLRFTSKDLMFAHQNMTTINCPRCGVQCQPKNLKRHQNTRGCVRAPVSDAKMPQSIR